MKKDPVSFADKKAHYIQLRDRGVLQGAARRQAGISRASANRIDRTYGVGREPNPDELPEPAQPDDVTSSLADDVLNPSAERPRNVLLEISVPDSLPDASPFESLGWKGDTAHGVGIPRDRSQPLPPGHPALSNQSYIPGSTGRKIDPNFPGPDPDLHAFTGRR